MMRWFVMKKVRNAQRFGYEEIIYNKASRYFQFRKEAEKEMRRLKKKHPKISYKIGGGE